MIIRGILFSGVMALANVKGIKSQTRRHASNQNAQRLLKFWQEVDAPITLFQREAFRLEKSQDAMNPAAISALNFTQLPVWFEADVGKPDPTTLSAWDQPFGRLRASMHMPKWASRCSLEITDIHEQALGNITAEDACAEGISQLTRDGETRFGILGRHGATSETAGGWEWEDWQPDAVTAYFRLYAMVNKMRASDIDLSTRVIALKYFVRNENILQLTKETV